MSSPKQPYPSQAPHVPVIIPPSLKAAPHPQAGFEAGTSDQPTLPDEDK
jgi:hypothetical protein